MRHFSKYSCPLLLLCCWSLAGCGSGPYEAQFKKTLEAYEKDTPFKDLFKTPSEFPVEMRKRSVLLSVRVPAIFDDTKYEACALVEGSADPRNPEETVVAHRVQPEFFKLDEHVITYERILEHTDSHNTLRRIPLFCYVVVVPKKNLDATETLKDEIHDQLKTAFPSDIEMTAGQKRKYPKAKLGVRDWTTQEVPKPDGTTVTIHQTSAEGQKGFVFYDDKKKPKLKSEINMGYFLVTINSQPTANVVIACFTTYLGKNESGVQALAAAMAGTVDVSIAEPGTTAKGGTTEK